MTNILISRSVLLLPVSLIITIVSLSNALPKLRALAKQPIYTEGPSWHNVKSGTPTMGGISFLLVFLVIAVIALPSFTAENETNSLLLLSAFSLLNGAVGIFDDVMKLKHKQNKGLSAKQKIILQTILAVIFLTLRGLLFDDGTEIRIFNITFDLGILYYPLSVLLILGAINCANLTDGVDGLLSSVTLIASVIMSVVSIALGSVYAMLWVALWGMMLAFLFYNVFPARIFMGDTGSLFIGAFIISTLYSMKIPVAFFSLGSVFIIEGFSVILQVLVYKITKKRLFLMSPIHHHLERRGFSETQICIMGIIMTLASSMPVLLLAAI